MGTMSALDKELLILGLISFLNFFSYLLAFCVGLLILLYQVLKLIYMQYKYNHYRKEHVKILAQGYTTTIKQGKRVQKLIDSYKHSVN